MPANIPYRIDAAQNAVPPSMGALRRRGRKSAAADVGGENRGFNDQQRPECLSSQKPSHSETGHFISEDQLFEDAHDPETWLRDHAVDLVGHLQNWSIDLDQREASLNARIALHDRRERQFRIQRSELTQQLASGQARVDELRRQLEARTRRLAFKDRS